MTPSSMDSLDVVEMVMSVEEAFDVEIPLGDAETFLSPSKFVDHLELYLSNRRLNLAAATLLKKPAKNQARTC